MYKPGRHLGVESSEMLSVSDRNGGSRTPRELVNLLHRKIKSVFPNLREFNLHLHSMIDGMIDGSRLSDERFAITQTSRRKKDVASSRNITTGTAL